MAERGWERRFEQYAAGLIGKGGIPGAAVALAHNGDVLYERGFGHRDAARKLPVTPDTRFGLGSVTKSFPSLAIMQLAEAGTLTVNDPVTTWLPEFRLPHPDDAQYTPQITIHHFMTHSSGLPPEPALLHARAGSIAADPDLERMSPRPMGAPADIATWERVQTYEGLMALMARQSFRVLGPPGAVINYSNEGYVLLAAIVERASGQTFEEYLNQHILTPLAMTRTGLYTRATPAQEPEVVPFAVGIKDGQREVFGSPAWWDQGSMFGNGGLKSTVQDLLRYLEIYRTGGTGGEGNGVRVLSGQGIATMSTPHMPNPLGGGYGYGLRVADVPGIGRTVGHSGGNKGVAAQVFVLPEHQVTAVALTNLANAPATQLASAVVNAFLGQPPETPWPTYPEHQLDRKQLSRFVGVYHGQPGAIARVAERNGALYVALADELQRTRPYSDNGFVIEATGEPVCFMLRESGEAWALFSGLRTMRAAASV